MSTPDLLDNTQLLIRIDERTAQFSVQIQDLKSELREIKQEAITRAEFQPVQWIAYGLIAIMATAVMGALLTRVIVKKPS